jgi:phosphatidylethanolamine/phosphatidyl-N-methylethanolamine N-methyltransferase
MKFTIESAKSIKNFKTSGTIFPCSKYAAKYALKRINLKDKKSIIELGCGTGVFTKEIIKQKSKETNFFAIEINEELAKEARKKVPEAKIYADSAENTNKYLKINNLKETDIIISTLPWAAFKKDLQIKLLDEILKDLKEGGEFITIAYILGNRLKNGKNFYKLLKGKFKSVKKTRPVIKNIPPAFFYHCIK